MHLDALLSMKTLAHAAVSQSDVLIDMIGAETYVLDEPLVGSLKVGDLLTQLSCFILLLCCHGMLWQHTARCVSKLGVLNVPPSTLHQQRSRSSKINEKDAEQQTREAAR